jgi:hypothetical protein
MTGTELKTLVRDLLFEDVAAAGSGLTSDAKLTTVIAIANQEVWQWAVDASPSTFAERAEFTVPQDVGYVSLVDGVDAVSLPAMLPMLLGGVGTAIYRPTNLLAENNGVWYPLEPGIAQRLSRSVENAEDCGLSVPSAYYFEGDLLFLAPRLVQDATVRMTYVPEVADLTADMQALSGKLRTFHPLVAYHACVLYRVKDAKDPTSFVGFRDELKRSMLTHLKKRHSQKGRVIREEAYD